MQLVTILQDSYGLKGSLTLLEGELDQNFLFEGEFGQHIFKLMRADCDAAFIDMQVKAHQHVENSALSLEIPMVIPTLSGDELITIPTPSGDRLGWMISFVGGALMAKSTPWAPTLTASIGASLAELDLALKDFAHPELDRPLPWDLLQAAWIKEKLHLHSGRRRAIIDTVVSHYDALLPELRKCPRAVIHNDANEMNVFVSGHTAPTRMCGLIDFGDMTYSARIGEAAVAAAYAILDVDDPLANAAALLAGYHAITPLEAIEIELFFPLVLTRLAVSVTNSAERKITDPNDPYLVINEAPAWRLLEALEGINMQLATAYFRQACGLDASDTCDEIQVYLSVNRGAFSPIFDDTDLSHAFKLDLSYGSATAVNLPEATDTHALSAAIKADMDAAGATVAVGGWGEARPIYNGAAYGRGGADPLGPARTHHLGVDISLAEGTTVRAPAQGTAWAAGFAEDPLDYGGYVILEHEIPSGSKFYSLYGHLEPSSLAHLTAGCTVKPGDPIGKIGDHVGNGGWWPHLHLQLMTEEPAKGGTPPGACEHQFWEAASHLNPNPAMFLNLPDIATSWKSPDKSDQLKRRRIKSPSNQKLTYKNPLQIARGWKHFLCDQDGHTYIDAYNNVPHVGHAHPGVIKAVTRQMQLVTTNTRYVHESLMEFAEALTAKLPSKLSKCIFTSSASEANELAIRLARKATGAKDMLVMEHGYHGITTGAMAISPYKFNQKGGEPQESWVHVTPQPDPYRGRYANMDNVASTCAADTQEIIQRLASEGRRIAGFISECLPSVGGQLAMPEGSLSQIYSAVRAAGGLCIADDVQTSLGRLGDYFWGFEYQNVVPDIIVLGKPLGNGHPLAAVITTAKIADKFAGGPELFSTFGGSTVSCTAGLAVLHAIEKGRLQENAQETGAYLHAGFRRLQKQFPVIGDVRGMGLFWGLDLVLDPQTREPATTIADYVKNRLYEKRVLIGTDGPFDNVLKVRPPLTFDRCSADALLHRLELVLKEKPAQP